jgi:hypothetical protein
MTDYIGAPARILDFDTESRPLSYLGSDYTTAELTAIAACWVDKPRSMRVWVLGHECSSCGHNDGSTMEEMLDGFLALWNKADMVSCHNLRRHDLPRINAMLLELGRPGLSPKLVEDTYGDLKRKNGVSGSQESLATMLGVAAPKVGMSTPSWRLANRLLPQGLAKTRARVVGDVTQHMELRKELVSRGWLRTPHVWQP